ncbi:MAG: helix-turn-helix domain-containing protein [Lachnospiraceae bacterium]|nr:helix-turn-helix domain-containing protein [Lachnospiraceae bacterium]
MIIKDELLKRRLSMYRLALMSEVPYATINDICNGKARLEKCTAETIYRIAQALDVPMEELLAPFMKKRPAFEIFKSTICHRLKELGDVEFIIKTLEGQEIRTYYAESWYPESLYLLAMLDYVSRENDIPLCSEYDDIRQCRLEKPLYPSGILALAAVDKNEQILREAEAEAIPEFRRFNIIENEVRNVV